MAFYDKIVVAYDELFPPNAQQLNFVLKLRNESISHSKILDVGCGTGSLAIALARTGALVRAFDYDAQMVAKAEEKRPQALNLAFSQGDMLEVAHTYEDVNFDMVVCLGNTLVHMPDLMSVTKVVADVAQRLATGGHFVFQIINYDRIIANQVTSLPTIDTTHFNFVRKYHHQTDGLIGFETILTDKKEGSEIVSRVPLYPLKKRDVVEILQSYFSSFKLYGGFDGSEWTPESFALVVDAVK